MGCSERALLSIDVNRKLKNKSRSKAGRAHQGPFLKKFLSKTTIWKYKAEANTVSIEVSPQ
jgi:hypothetical protein